jgi:hypothetical protein
LRAMSDRRYYGVARGRQGEFIAAIEADAAFR